jgi:hypothetical protein
MSNKKVNRDGIIKEVNALIIVNKTSNRGEKQDLDIFLEDGSAAYFHCDNEFMTLTLFQLRFNKNEMVINRYHGIGELLAKGKVYIKDFQNEKFVCFEMIKEALNWLYFPNHGFVINQIFSKDHSNVVQIIKNFLLLGEIPTNKERYVL